MSATEIIRRFLDPQELCIRPAIRMDRALLCLDCDSIFEAGGGESCPSCASTTSYAIGRVLNRTELLDPDKRRLALTA